MAMGTYDRLVVLVARADGDGYVRSIGRCGG